jgi:nicotinamidase-related amidase
MLIQTQRSCLLAIDIQEKLMAAIHEARAVIENCAWMLRLAARLHVPILASEQYPRGLGHTVPALQDLIPARAIMEKTCFSCAAEPDCVARIDACRRDQIIVMGAEAHVCVLQTALGLLEKGKEIYLLADCVSSRQPSNVHLAIERLRAEGVRIVSREMVAFEWLQRAGTDRFREISRNFLK